MERNLILNTKDGTLNKENYSFLTSAIPDET